MEAVVCCRKAILTTCGIEPGKPAALLDLIRAGPVQSAWHEEAELAEQRNIDNKNLSFIRIECARQSSKCFF